MICQKLVSSVIRGALSRRGVRGWVYLDDILLSCRSKSRLRGAVRDCIRRLRRAGFIVGAKSEPDPTERLGFIGKQIDTKAGTISNAVGALVGAFRAWIRGMGGGRLPSKVMERLLGKLCWLSRPNAGLGAFPAGAYRGLQSGKGVFGRGVCKGVATVLLFSCVPQRCDPPGPGGRGAWEVFVDAAPEGKRFRLGIVGGGDYYRSEVCPPWVDSLQQAELYALYIVIKLASYRGFERIRVGSDSNVARSQINALRASVHADSQQRILRRLFWLRCWSTVSVESFRVPSLLNAADPLSRETGFQSRKQAVAEAARRREMWEKAVDTKYMGLMEMIRPPWRFKGEVGD